MPRGPCDAAVGSGPPNPALVIGVGAARRYAGSLPASPALSSTTTLFGALRPAPAPVPPAPGGRPASGGGFDTFRGGDGAAPSASRP